MYKDEIWYRKLEQAVDEHREDFDEKQWGKYRIDLLLRVANRVREFSDECEVCRDSQHTITRLEEELQELPDSKAQRQYQAEQLRAFTDHFVAAHDLSAPGHFLRKWWRQGVLIGLGLGFLVSLFITGNILHLVLGAVLGAAAALAYGYIRDQQYQSRKRMI